jgi:hypothetical protein
VSRRIETPGVFAAIAYAESQAARTSFETVLGTASCSLTAAVANLI